MNFIICLVFIIMFLIVIPLFYFNFIWLLIYGVLHATCYFLIASLLVLVIIYRLCKNKKETKNY
jgi:membrane protein implicated in regulation of membrane protease activity